MGKQAPKRESRFGGVSNDPLFASRAICEIAPSQPFIILKKGKAGGKHNDLTQGAEEMTAKTQQRPAAASSGKRQEIGFLEF